MIAQKCLVLTIFGLFGLFSFFLLGSHFWVTARFEELKNGGAPYPGISDENLFHFIQVSDIHISVHDEQARIDDFNSFCDDTIKLINPDLVLVTGDLIDAKSKNKFESVQYREEWEVFSDAIKKIEPKVISIRGNHDASNQLAYQHSLYVEFLEDEAIRNSLYTHQKPFGNYSFIAIDAANDPGFKRPFNFVGYIPESGQEELIKMGTETRNHNQTIVFGHYPTSTLYLSNYIRKIFNDISVAYLCGHLHNGGGAITKMQHMHKNGIAELELADWKKSRVFRIMSFDHDLLSFTDFKWGPDKAFVHITNPPQWQLTNPNKQPIDRVMKSTHVRALIFSPEEIIRVMVNVDGRDEEMIKSGQYLWTASWNPRDTQEGTVIVTAHLASGKYASSMKNYKTNYDEIKSSTYSVPGTFILSVDFCLYFAIAFWFGISIPLIFMFLMSKYYAMLFRRQENAGKNVDKSYKWRPALPSPRYKCPNKLKWNFFLRFQILFGYEPYFSHLSLPLAVWSIWIMFFPWFIGNLVDDENGTKLYAIVSSWGIFYKGKLHKSHEVFASGFWDVVTFLWPTLLYCSYYSERHWSSQSVSRIFYVFFIVMKVFIFALRIFALYGVASSYGICAALSPVYLFPPIFIMFSSYCVYFKFHTKAKANK